MPTAARISPLAVVAVRQALKVARSSRMPPQDKEAVVAYVAAVWGALLQQHQQHSWRLALAALLQRMLLSEAATEGQELTVQLPACAQPLHSLWRFATAVCEQQLDVAAGQQAGSAKGLPPPKRRKLGPGNATHNSGASSGPALSQLHFQVEEGQQLSAADEVVQQALVALLEAGGQGDAQEAAALAAQLAATCAAHCTDLSCLKKVAELPQQVLEQLPAPLLLRTLLRSQKLCQKAAWQQAVQTQVVAAAPGRRLLLLQQLLFWLPSCTSEQQLALAFQLLQLCVVPAGASGAATATGSSKADPEAAALLCADQQLREEVLAALQPGRSAAAGELHSARALLLLRLLGQLQSSGLQQEQLGAWHGWVSSWACCMARCHCLLYVHAWCGSIPHTRGCCSKHKLRATAKSLPPLHPAPIGPSGRHCHVGVSVTVCVLPAGG